MTKSKTKTSATTLPAIEGTIQTAELRAAVKVVSAFQEGFSAIPVFYFLAIEFQKASGLSVVYRGVDASASSDVAGATGKGSALLPIAPLVSGYSDFSVETAA